MLPSVPESSLDTSAGAFAPALDVAIGLRAHVFHNPVDLNVKEASGAGEDRSLDGAGLWQSQNARKAIRRAAAEAQTSAAVFTASPDIQYSSYFGAGYVCHLGHVQWRGLPRGEHLHMDHAARTPTLAGRSGVREGADARRADRRASAERRCRICVDLAGLKVRYTLDIVEDHDLDLQKNRKVRFNIFQDSNGFRAHEVTLACLRIRTVISHTGKDPCWRSNQSSEYIGGHAIYQIVVRIEARWHGIKLWVMLPSSNLMFGCDSCWRGNQTFNLDERCHLPN